MSNAKNSSKKIKSTPPTSPHSDTPESGPAAVDKIKRWSYIQNDLEQALGTWDELEKTEKRLSPEEEQFEKIKSIIGELKDKLDEF